MCANKKSCSNAATLEQAVENGLPVEITPDSYFNHNTNNNGHQQGFVERFLKKGAENATPARELVKLAGCADTRSLQVLIAKEREQGKLILSTSQNGGGYFLPDDGEKGRREIAEFVNTLYSRALNTLRAAKHARRELEKIDGQGALEELIGEEAWQSRDG